jgi:hypothetical protein
MAGIRAAQTHNFFTRPLRHHADDLRAVAYMPVYAPCGNYDIGGRYLSHQPVVILWTDRVRMHPKHGRIGPAHREEVALYECSTVEFPGVFDAPPACRIVGNLIRSGRIEHDEQTTPRAAIP